MIFFSFLRFSQRFIYFLFGDSFLFYNTLFLFLCGSLRLSDNLIGSQRSVSTNQNFMKFIWNENAFSWRFKLTQTHMKSICIVICQIFSWRCVEILLVETNRNEMVKSINCLKQQRAARWCIRRMLVKSMDSWNCLYSFCHFLGSFVSKHQFDDNK